MASVDFTCDQWSTLLHTIERMSQLGVYTERGLGSSSSTSFSAVTSAFANMQASDSQQQHQQQPLQSQISSSSHQMKHVATSLTLFGPDSQEAIEHSFSSPSAAPSKTSSNRPSTSSSSSHQSHQSQQQSQPSSIFTFHTNYTSWTHPNYHSSVYHSPISLHGYYRSCSVLSNSQSILPSLIRPIQQGTAMFGSGAYLHQYTTNGLELDEFISSFRYLGHVIQNYRGL